MNSRLITPLVVLALAGCGPSAEEKIAALDAERAQVFADLIRHESECRAQAVEFAADPRIAASCLDAYRVIAETSARVVADIDRRATEIRAAK